MFSTVWVSAGAQKTMPEGRAGPAIFCGFHDIPLGKSDWVIAIRPKKSVCFPVFRRLRNTGKRFPEKAPGWTTAATSPAQSGRSCSPVGRRVLPAAAQTSLEGRAPRVHAGTSIDTKVAGQTGNKLADAVIKGSNPAGGGHPQAALVCSCTPGHGPLGSHPVHRQNG